MKGIQLFGMDGTSFTFRVPVGLPDITPVFICSASNSSSHKNTRKYVNALEGSDHQTIGLEAGPELTSPADGATDINATTQFTSSILPDAVNIISFERNEESFVVITKNQQLHFLISLPLVFISRRKVTIGGVSGDTVFLLWMIWRPVLLPSIQNTMAQEQSQEGGNLQSGSRVYPVKHRKTHIFSYHLYGEATMKLISKSALSFLYAAVILLTGGCDSDDSSTDQNPPAPITVTGKVMDGGAGNGTGIASVAIGNQIVATSADGSFTLTNVSTPYDITVVQTNPEGEEFATIYQGLTVAHPQIVAAKLSEGPNHATMRVSIPTLSPGQQALVFFSNGSDIVASKTLDFPGTQADFAVVWSGSASVSGKLAILIYSKDLGGSITTYDSYGEKPAYTLNNGSVQSETFKETDLPLNPGETEVSGSLIAPSGYTNTRTTLHLRLGQQVNTDLVTNELTSMDGTSFAFKAPGGLPGVTIVLSGHAASPAGGRTDKYVNASEGSGNTLTLDAVPQLITPADGATAIDTTVQFTYSAPPGNGIYGVSFSATKKSFSVITDKTTVRIPNLSLFGLSLGAATPYTWRVYRIPDFTSTDDLASSFLNKHTGSQTASEKRNFTTP